MKPAKPVRPFDQCIDTTVYHQKSHGGDANRNKMHKLKHRSNIVQGRLRWLRVPVCTQKLSFQKLVYYWMFATIQSSWNLRNISHTEQVRRPQMPLVPLLKKISGGCQMSMLEHMCSPLNRYIHVFITLKCIPSEIQWRWCLQKHNPQTQVHNNTKSGKAMVHGFVCVHRELSFKRLIYTLQDVCKHT